MDQHSACGSCQSPEEIPNLHCLNETESGKVRSHRCLLFIQLPILCVLDFLHRLPDLDLIRHQWVLNRIAEQTSGYFKEELAFFSVANFWVLPRYSSGSTVLYSRFNVQLTSLSESEELE